MRDAGPVGWVNCFSICASMYNAESPKQGSRRFNSIVKTKYIDNLGTTYIPHPKKSYTLLITYFVSKTQLIHVNVILFDLTKCIFSVQISFL